MVSWFYRLKSLSLPQNDTTTQEIINHNGIVYSVITTSIPQVIHCLEFSLADAALKLVHATGSGNDRESVSSLAQRYGAQAGTNAGFYRRGGRFNGNSLGILKIDNEWFSDPQLSRGSLGISSDGKHVLIDQIEVKWNLTLNGVVFPINRLNQPRSDKESVLYNHQWRNSTLTDAHGKEVVVAHDTIIEVISRQGNAHIPQNGFVYSVHTNAHVDLNALKPGMPAHLSYSIHSLTGKTTSEQWEAMSSIVAGVPLLIYDNTLIADYFSEMMLGKQIIHSGDERAADFHRTLEQLWLVAKRHPRTAIGIKGDNTIVLVVVDGRNSEISQGMTMNELAQFLKNLNCHTALNLGGGGCSTMYVEGNVVNAPSGSEDGTGTAQERPVSDALLITPLKIEAKQALKCSI